MFCQGVQIDEFSPFAGWGAVSATRPWHSAVRRVAEVMRGFGLRPLAQPFTSRLRGGISLGRPLF